MTAELRRGIVLAVVGLLLGLGLVAAFVGGGDVWKRLAPATEPAPAPAPQAGTAEAPRALADVPRSADLPGAAEPAAPAQRKDAAAADPEALKFDIVRVEPNGESVVAGRGAPNTVVELLVDGKATARALADPNGQFAIVPPALPSGNSEIVLRSTNAAGRETRSKDSVAVAVSPSRTEKPLVALTSPDKPTVVLSQPDAPVRIAAKPDGKVAGNAATGKETTGKETTGREAAVRDPGGKGSAGRAPPVAEKPAAKEAPAPVKIVSVDAQEGGRLFVTSQAPPGATVRLYLNDTLIAPASVGADGKVTFTIGRGVKPGAYMVRVDQVDSVSGKVRGRAEVPFTVPEPARIAAAKPPEPPAQPPAAREGAAPKAAAPNAAAPEAGHAGPAMAQVPAARGPTTQAPTSQAPTAHVPAPPAAPKPAGPAPQVAEGPVPPSSPAAEAAPAGVFVAEVNTAKIIRGDNLWQISRRTYGAGDRYTVIYDANQDQIRNPDLIYPGQIFVLPSDAEKAKPSKRG